jgi:hypothetical protein
VQAVSVPVGGFQATFAHRLTDIEDAACTIVKVVQRRRAKKKNRQSAFANWRFIRYRRVKS